MKKNLPSLKILIIEDDEDDYIIIKDLLNEIETNDFETTWAPDYDMALDLLENRAHDICMLDYHLGSHNGLEILNEVSKRGIDIPVIFLTGRGEYQVDVQAMEAGAADYIVKDNFTSSLLERSVRYTIDRTRTAHALQKAHDRLEEEVRQRTSELINANNELKKASEKIQSFAFSISHDLKSPATALYGLTRRLFNCYGNALDNKGNKYCEHILHASEQILSLVEKINIFISEKEMPLTIEELKFSELLNEIKVEFLDRIINRELDWIVPEELPSIRADRLSIIRILRNLVENAFKYGGDSLSYIRVGFEETGNSFIISVSDNGLGLKKNINKDIFLPFERTGMTKEVEGSGLGLAIVKEIAEKHGGEVWTSQSSDRGVTFHFSISKYL